MVVGDVIATLSGVSLDLLGGGGVGVAKNPHDSPAYGGETEKHSSPKIVSPYQRAYGSHAVRKVKCTRALCPNSIKREARAASGVCFTRQRLWFSCMFSIGDVCVFSGFVFLVLCHVLCSANELCILREICARMDIVFLCS